jgi:AmpD protein
MRKTILQTPNISKGVKIRPIGIVLHHTAGSYNGSVSWCMNAKSKVAYHIIVNTNGDYTQLADDTQRVWANGVSSFKGRSNCNNFMISISVSGDTYNRDLTIGEINTVALLCIEKMKKWNFGIDMVTTHRHISPSRKTDINPISEKQILNQINLLLR